jgi:hypothetical protein
MVTLVQTYCEQGVDGFILNVTEDINERCYDIIHEAGIPIVSDSTDIRSADTGLLLCPGVELDAYSCGADLAQWVSENYQNYGFDLSDLSDVGLIIPTYSAVVSFNNRAAGAGRRSRHVSRTCRRKTFFMRTHLLKAIFPLNRRTQRQPRFLAAHPNMGTWIIIGVLDPLCQGAVRAIEQMDLESKTLAVSVGGEALVQEWDAGYEGCWVACGYFEAMDFVKQNVPALTSVINGEATLEDLFPEWKDEGETYGVYKIRGDMATIDTYEEIREEHASID